MLSLAAVRAETVWPPKLKILDVWSSVEKVF